MTTATRVCVHFAKLAPAPTIVGRDRTDGGSYVKMLLCGLWQQDCHNQDNQKSGNNGMKSAHYEG